MHSFFKLQLRPLYLAVLPRTKRTGKKLIWLFCLSFWAVLFTAPLNSLPAQILAGGFDAVKNNHSIFSDFSEILKNDKIIKSGKIQQKLNNCWNYKLLTGEIEKIASDNMSTIFLLTTEGFVTSLSLKGEISWITDNGKLFNTNLLAAEDSIFLTGFSPSSLEFQTNIISTDTGIIKNRSFINTKQITADPSNFEYQLRFTDRQLFLQPISQNSEANNAIVSTVNDSVVDVFVETLLFSNQNSIKTEVKSTANIPENKNFLPKEKTPKLQNKLNESLKSGYNSPGKLNLTFISDNSGKITVFKNRQLLWKTRIGAAATRISETNSGILISSNDNFVYLLKKNNGQILWKYRLTGRAFAVFNSSDQFVYAVSTDKNEVILLNEKDGKLHERFQLANSESANGLATGTIFVLDGLIIVTTDNQISSFTSLRCPA